MFSPDSPFALPVLFDFRQWQQLLYVIGKQITQQQRIFTLRNLKTANRVSPGAPISFTLQEGTDSTWLASFAPARNQSCEPLAAMVMRHIP